MQTFDLEAQGLRELNSTLHAQVKETNQTSWEVINPKGSHAIAVGLDAPIEVNIKGSTGYYCGGMNKQATINVLGSSHNKRFRFSWPRYCREYDVRKSCD